MRRERFSRTCADMKQMHVVLISPSRCGVCTHKKRWHRHAGISYMCRCRHAYTCACARSRCIYTQTQTRYVPLCQLSSAHAKVHIHTMQHGMLHVSHLYWTLYTNIHAHIHIVWLKDASQSTVVCNITYMYTYIHTYIHAHMHTVWLRGAS